MVKASATADREFVLRSDDDEDRQRWIVTIALSDPKIAAVTDGKDGGTPSSPPATASSSAVTASAASAASASDPKLILAEKQWLESCKLWDGNELSNADKSLLSKEQEADHARCFTLLQSAASAGHAEACNRLGRCFREGVGTTTDIKQAFKSFEAAAKAGLEAKANFNLGMCYEMGWGVPINVATAKLHYKLSAAKDHPKAQISLYRLDSAYYTSLAGKSDVVAQVVLSHCYARGIPASPAVTSADASGGSVPAFAGLTKDEGKALEYAAFAAKTGHAPAQCLLGEYARHTTPHMNQSYRLLCSVVLYGCL